jgi:hypothetical protein
MYAWDPFVSHNPSTVNERGIKHDMLSLFHHVLADALVCTVPEINIRHVV